MYSYLFHIAKLKQEYEKEFWEEQKLIFYLIK